MEFENLFDPLKSFHASSSQSDSEIFSDQYSIKIPRGSRLIIIRFSHREQLLDIPRLSLRDENNKVIDIHSIKSSPENLTTHGIDNFSGEIVNLSFESSAGSCLQLEIPLEADCITFTLNKQGDYFYRYSGLEILSVANSSEEKIFDFSAKFKVLCEMACFLVDSCFSGKVKVDFRSFLEFLSLDLDIGEEDFDRAKDFVWSLRQSHPYLLSSTYIKNLAISRGLLINQHGLVRPFSSYSAESLKESLSAAIALHSEINQLGVRCSFGFGTALGFKRNSSFIPWDDDLDLIIWGWSESQREEILSIATKLDLNMVEKYSVNDSIHVVLNGSNGINLDLFFGVCSADESEVDFGIGPVVDINLLRDEESICIMGLETPILIEAENYLNLVYGPNWSHGDEDFIHSRK
jgi:hypothetical protein